jgi:hypothetical protein
LILLQFDYALNRWNIEPAIFKCYRPLLSLVVFVRDLDFLEEIMKEIGAASRNLREEESYLEPQMLLKALITLATRKISGKATTKRINVMVSDIEPTLRSEFGVNCPVFQLSANQRSLYMVKHYGWPNHETALFIVLALLAVVSWSRTRY